MTPSRPGLSGEFWELIFANFSRHDINRLGYLAEKFMDKKSQAEPQEN